MATKITKVRAGWMRAKIGRREIDVIGDVWEMLTGPVGLRRVRVVDDREALEDAVLGPDFVIDGWHIYLAHGGTVSASSYTWRAWTDATLIVVSPEGVAVVDSGRVNAKKATCNSLAVAVAGGGASGIYDGRCGAARIEASCRRLIAQTRQRIEQHEVGDVARARQARAEARATRRKFGRAVRRLPARRTAVAARWAY